MNNIVIPYDKRDRLRAFYYAFHTKKTSFNSADSSNDPAVYLDDTNAQFKYRLAYYPAVPQYYLELNCGGEPMVLNMN